MEFPILAKIGGVSGYEKVICGAVLLHETDEVGLLDEARLRVTEDGATTEATQLAIIDAACGTSRNPIASIKLAGELVATVTGYGNPDEA